MWQEWALYFLSPLTLALVTWLLAGVFLATGRRRVAVTLASIAFVGLWVASTPAVAIAGLGWLEGQYPAVSAEDTPQADAIVLLGGMVAGAQPPRQPSITLSPAANRAWHAAALYHAGKAKWIVVAAGNRPAREHLQPEAEVITHMLVRLGVPREVILLESSSRTTRGNARNVRPLLRQVSARRVLLVTSAQHMPRAMETFVKVWGDPSIVILPAAGGARSAETSLLAWKLWLPSLDGLIGVTSSLKEFAGLAALAIIGVTG